MLRCRPCSQDYYGPVIIFHLSIVFLLHRNMLPCSSVWMLPPCLKKSYATPKRSHSSGTALDRLCKHLAEIIPTHLPTLCASLHCLRAKCFYKFFHVFCVFCVCLLRLLSAFLLSAQGEVLWLSALSHHKICSCSRSLTPGRRERKRRRMTTTGHPTTLIFIHITTTIYTHW